MSADAEVIVVGGGAAGAAAAVHLALRGRAVHVLTQQCGAPAPGCGGGMAASVQRWFPFDLAPAVEQVIRRVRFTWNLADPVVADLPGEAPFWIVDRPALDRLLLARAVEHGATVQEGASVTSLQREGSLWCASTATGKPLRAPAVVLASGSSSPLPAALGLGPSRPRFATAMAAAVDPASDGASATAEPPEATAWFEFGLVHHGFSWVFPRRRGHSIGVGTFLDQGRDGVDFQAVLGRLLPALGCGADQGERRLLNLRIWNGHHRLHREGIVAVGDAASLCDPFLAEGIRPALLSGTLAAEALDGWLAGDAESLQHYSARIRRDWGDSMAWGRRIAQVFYRFPGVGYQLGIKRPTAPQRIAQILSGSMGYGDIAQRVIRRLLLQRS
ncbi:NAD(P)/FAD-dependent oxidoreductase [Synechococcus sp. RSCCF101]|uniref:NAD(P)/FAD-dependent oxidoreductase n=1 Tax=Synechococcus sp. RSCCF101 TaxID=2511069 RepID=UPI001247C6BD|nr:NAD(P)/FAD-dependent oxidoreductase [Synechococcus sp. RSCCF101]QEY31375.1 NAD(P)/FAD-dependent oxidoreductase [Synechococcus sp. RSCCF101]